MSGTQGVGSSIISARNQLTLESIKDPLLKIKRSVERFGRDMIDVAQRELAYSKEAKDEMEYKDLAIKIAT